MIRLLWLLAGIFGAAAVMLGAYGAHGLAADEAVIRNFLTGNQYHMWHVLAAVGALLLGQGHQGWTRRLATGSVLLFISGCVMFSGPLYATAIMGDHAFGFFAPWGGISFMIGWLALGLAGLFRGR